MNKNQPYNERLGHPHDFEVEYKILNTSEGGRKGLPYQAIRWDFWYEFNGKHENQLFMIYPEFLDSNGNVIIEKNVPVPATGIARMWIVSDSMRKYHENKIKVGLSANGYEGGIVVAKYVVSKIVGLMTNPTKE